MWLALDRTIQQMLLFEERQSIYPAPDGSDQELLIITRARLEQKVLLATPRVARVAYKIDALEASMVLGAQRPAPWPEPTKLVGRTFELMLTDKGPLVVPGEGERLPTKLASWMDQVAENLRSCWPVPPERIEAGSEWDAMPAVPGGLPAGATSALIKVQNRVEELSGTVASIATKFGVRVVFEASNASAARRGEGRGEVRVRLDRLRGVLAASRQGRLELIRPHSKNQVLRSTLNLAEA
jgi:hypothetical protein